MLDDFNHNRESYPYIGENDVLRSLEYECNDLWLRVDTEDLIYKALVIAIIYLLCH